MSKPLLQGDPGSPEKFVDEVRDRLGRQALWDALLVFSPPLLVLAVVAVFLFDSHLTLYQGLILAALPLFGVALLLGVLRYRPRAPSVRFAARLIDDRVEAKDRFVTLATINPSISPPPLITRLRQEAYQLLHRIDRKKDFPYRVNRSFFTSLLASLVILLFFYLLLQITSPSLSRVSTEHELALLAQELSEFPLFSELARKLERLAIGLQKQYLSEAEKQALIQELSKMVERFLKNQEQGGAANDLLDQLAEALRELGQGGEGKQEKGGGRLKTNLPEEREGKGKESAKGSGGEGQGQSKASQTKETQGEKSAQKGNQPDKGESQSGQGRGERSKDDRQERKEQGGMAKADQEGRGAKNKHEETPRGTPPAERFTKPGEQGEKGLKDPRFVTVEVPEEEIPGATGGGGSSKRRELRSKLPVSNAPLRRPDSPDASPEKQQMPLEYRGVIR